jgi:hypothetical protein
MSEEEKKENPFVDSEKNEGKTDDKGSKKTDVASIAIELLDKKRAEETKHLDSPVKVDVEDREVEQAALDLGIVEEPVRQNIKINHSLSIFYVEFKMKQIII